MNITINADAPPVHPAHSRSLSSSSAYSSNSLFPPSTSPHGPHTLSAPKSPGALSTRSNRSPPFPGMGLPSSPRPSGSDGSRTPRSPMSPPMSAQSFGTFIDSEPSTPAYSPRGSRSTWDNSTLVLLSPISSVASSPREQQEPGWTVEQKTIQKPPKRMTRHGAKPQLTQEVSLGAALSSWPTTPAVPEIREEGCTCGANLNPNSNPKPAANVNINEEIEEEKPGAEEESKAQAPTASTSTSTREKLTTRMKSLLRRRTEKRKAEKKRREFELDRVETTHWTEL